MKKQGSNFFGLSLLAFFGLGLELPAALLIEPLIYHKEMADWGTAESVLHWIVTCIIWGVVAILLGLFSAKKLNFNLLKQKEKLTVSNWLIVLAVLAVNIAIGILDWNGFKPVIEFQSRGLIQFIFQYLYYAFEAVLVFLVVAFGQKAGELLFKNEKFPWGGLLAGLTWGLVHMLTKGDITTGLLAGFAGILYGIIYIGAKRNTIIAYLFILLAFAL